MSEPWQKRARGESGRHSRLTVGRLGPGLPAALAAYQAHGRSSSSTGFSPDGDELLPLVEGARLRGVGEGAS
ncbi:MAG: hypothetical protein KIS95_14015 [Anaerolineae bacterium]|uniref:hypothetical protein n=1 Tax=Promineifilum sp. TaxID=2664178 RepID=UPI002411C21D|nr:hypothetical protein [Promineifilum sp.]MCW5848344.1 hypothetical protein [Anaerolineae bacterium]